MKDRLPEDVEVACHNSSTNCTISGPAEKVSALAERLKQEGIFVKAVNVSNIAFHSKHIREMGPKLKEELSRVSKTHHAIAAPGGCRTPSSTSSSSDHHESEEEIEQVDQLQRSGEQVGRTGMGHLFSGVSHEQSVESGILRRGLQAHPEERNRYRDRTAFAAHIRSQEIP